MREWYDGYRFARQAETSVYNTAMVLYFLTPDELIDHNVRIDYGTLRHLLVVNRQAAARQADINGNFDMLRDIIADGRAKTRISISFPLQRLADRKNFLSLLYYFGLLSIHGSDHVRSDLAIPNQTVRHLMYGYPRDAWDDARLFPANMDDLIALMNDMAYAGTWRPAFDYLSTVLAQQTGICDYMFGEKVVQVVLATHFGLTEYFLVRSEYELNKGYADLYLEPDLARFPGMIMAT